MGKYIHYNYLKQELANKWSMIEINDFYTLLLIFYEVKPNPVRSKRLRKKLGDDACWGTTETMLSRKACGGRKAIV